MTHISTWQISFNIKYCYIAHIEDFLDLVASSVSMRALESTAIEINPEDLWCVDVYFQERPNLSAMKKYLLDAAKKHNFAIKDIRLIEVQDHDWVAEVQNNFKPFIVGRFFIASDYYKHTCPADKILMIINASRAFGTGEHQTTQCCINALEYLAQTKFHNILDIGTGTGILAIASATIWNAQVIASDIDEIAVSIARENSVINNMKDSISFFVANGYQQSEIKAQKFDLIISNILAKPLIDLAGELSAHLLPGGYAVLSGFLNNQVDSVVNVHKEYGLSLVKLIQKDDWVAAILKKH